MIQALVGAEVGVTVGVDEAVGVSEGSNVAVGVGVEVGVGVRVGGSGVTVEVAVRVGVAVLTGSGVEVAEGAGVKVGDGVLEEVGAGAVAVGVGEWLSRGNGLTSSKPTMNRASPIRPTMIFWPSLRGGAKVTSRIGTLKLFLLPMPSAASNHKITARKMRTKPGASSVQFIMLLLVDGRLVIMNNTDKPT
jgi:hypothetical protein